MGWAKYDEDNRDYIEERWSMTGYTPDVFNYTANYRMSRGKTYVPAYVKTPHANMVEQPVRTISRRW